MKFLNAAQFAFILDMKQEDARAMMCRAWAKAKGIQNAAAWERTRAGSDTYKIVDPYPRVMEISMLAENLNLPTLQQSCDDIENNYLKRPGSHKWILCDYPEKKIGAGDALKIPKALDSLLPTSVKVQILDE